MKKLVSYVLTAVIAISCLAIPAKAATIKQDAMYVEENDVLNNFNEVIKTVTFKDVAKNPNQEYNGIAKDGSEYVVSIEEVAHKTKASTRTWKVSFTSGIVNCHFYMDVSGNKCTRGYDKKIITIGCTYSNVDFTRGSSYCKLSFDVSSYMDIVNFNGWLKGTCTGSDNDITVSWSF